MEMERVSHLKTLILDEQEEKYLLTMLYTFQQWHSNKQTKC